MIIALGGAGFIGKHLQALLLAQAIPFTVISRRPPSAATMVEPGFGFMSSEAFMGPAGDRLIRSASGIVNMISSSVPGTFAAEPWREVPELSLIHI